MTIILQVAQQIVTSEEIIPLLAKYQMLPQLAKEIVLDEAIAKIECTPEETTMARQQFYQQHQINTEEQLQAYLQQQGMTPEQLDWQLVRRLKLEKFKQATWGKQVEAYFLKRKGQLDRAIYSLIRTQDAGVIQELYFRIQEGEISFAELAKQYSQGAEAETGGLIGPVELSVPHPLIAQKLAASEPGKLWPPIHVVDWWVIVRLEKFIAAQLDQPTQQRLIDELFQLWLSQQLQEKVSLQEI